MQPSGGLLAATSPKFFLPFFFVKLPHVGLRVQQSQALQFCRFSPSHARLQPPRRLTSLPRGSVSTRPSKTFCAFARIWQARRSGPRLIVLLPSSPSFFLFPSLPFFFLILFSPAVACPRCQLGRVPSFQKLPLEPGLRGALLIFLNTNYQ